MIHFVDAGPCGKQAWWKYHQNVKCKACSILLSLKPTIRGKYHLLTPPNPARNQNTLVWEVPKSSGPSISYSWSLGGILK